MQSTTSSTGGKTQLWKINDQKAQKNGPCQAVYWVREKSPSEHDAIKKRAKNGYKEEKIWTTGNVYKGEWFNNQKQGYGICIWSNGNKYEGDWAHDDREGHGVHWIKDKTTGKLRRVYAGNWKDDKKHGTGVYFYKDGSRYEGEFIADQRHGKGTQYYINGDVYVGEWKHDKQGGFGTLTKANGDVYEGDWLNGLREGSGIYFYKEKDKIYDGEWVADVAKCGVYTDAEHFFEPQVKIDDSIGKTGDDSDPYAPRMRRKQRAIPIPRLRLADPEGVLASCIEQIQKQRHTVRTLPYVELSTLFSATALDRLRTIYSRHDQPTSTSTSTSQRQHTPTEHVPVATLNKMLEEMGYEHVDTTRLAQVILDAGKSATEYLNFTDFVRCVHLYDAGESVPVADER